MKTKPGLKVALGSQIKKDAKGLVTDLYVANKQHEAARLELVQKVFNTNYHQMGDQQVIVIIESPPSPPAVDVNPTSTTPLGEQVDDDPIGLPIVADSGYEPILCLIHKSTIVFIIRR